MNLGTNLAIPEHSLQVGGAQEAEPMFTFKTLATRASVACLLLSLSVAPLFSQAAAEQKQPQAKTKAENDVYMQLDSYARLGDLDKFVETGERFIRDFPQADNNTKKFVLQRMMTAYQQKNDFAKIVEYGDKLLAIVPTDLPALLVVSSTLAEWLPTTQEDKKGAQVDKALDYCSRAKAGIELLQKPAQIPDEVWTAEKNKLLATVDSSIRLVHLNK